MWKRSAICDRERFRQDSRSQVERIGDEQAYPVTSQYHGHKEQLRKVKREIQWEERVCMNVKRVCPFYG